MYDELIKRLNAYSALYENHGGITAEAADAIEELSRENESLAKSVNEASEILRKRWIPVTERLPEYDSVVLVTDGEDVGTGYRYTLGEIGFTGWAVPFADIEEDNVSHWIPLPEPPKEG